MTDDADSSVYRRAMTRVQREFTKTTDALIQAIFQHSREPTDALAEKIRELEVRRDELHGRLEELEARAAAEKRKDP